MIFDLVEISKLKSNFSCKRKSVVLYADFNVINILFKQRLQVPCSVNLYYDSLLMTTALKTLGYKNVTKQVSTDIQYNLLTRSNIDSKRVFFFGDSKGTLSKLKKVMKITHPNLEIVGFVDGYDYNSNEVIKSVNRSKPDILFIGLGASRQEKWIIENYTKIEAGLILSVGGWFKYLAGEKKRAPKFLRQINLEWLHKLVTDFPRIWERYFIGAPAFLYRVFVSKEIELKLNE